VVFRESVRGEEKQFDITLPVLSRNDEGAALTVLLLGEVSWLNIVRIRSGSIPPKEFYALNLLAIFFIIALNTARTRAKDSAIMTEYESCCFDGLACNFARSLHQKKGGGL